MSKSIQFIFQLINIFLNEENCISFLIEKGVFDMEMKCTKCKTYMILCINRISFRCPKFNCRKEVSLRQDSFFSGNKVDCSKILLLGYLWLNKVKAASAVIMSGMSTHTICDFYGYFRQLVSDNVELEDAVIGGNDIIIEIDETKLGKRGGGEGMWVIGRVERTLERKIFLVEIKERSATLLTYIIKKHVRPGSIIYTDLWKGYVNLCNNNFRHHTVNHSKNYK
jgi:hypothetical protein